MLRTFVEVTHEANARYHAGKHDVNALSKASEMKVADLKETLSGMKFLNPEETKVSMESGNLHKFLEGMGTPKGCLLYTSPSPRDRTRSRMPSSA